MAEEEDQFCFEHEEEEVRQLQELQIPTPVYQKPLSDQPKTVTLKMVEIPKKQEPYVYQRFKLEKKEEQQQCDSDSDYNQEYESPFLEYYSSQQMIYKKYHNQAINKYNGTFYFAGSFVHKNIFTEANSQSYNFFNCVKEYYLINEQSLPQQSLSIDDLKFDSNFQSGNLFAAFKISQFQYDLVMEMDTNSRGNNQWFYFSVQKMITNKQYTFNVVNFTKSDALFNYGMCPAVFSVSDSLKYNIPEKAWKRQGTNVTYKRGKIPRQNSRRYYYSLSFKLVSKNDNDKLFVAHSYPYTYTKLKQYINDKCLKFKDIAQKFVVGKTVSKKVIQGLKITFQINKKRDNRKAIIIMARQHPGETQGSFVCDGVIQKLLSKTKEGQFLRKNYVFYVIPMVNPDGVIFGHYRTNMTGKDLNRKWDSTQKQAQCPQVTTIKAFLTQISKERQIRFILDLHGHSKKLNSFFYGNPCPQNPDVVRIFPFVCSKISQAIQFYDCTFSSQQYKRKAARVYLSFIYKLLHVYTFQSSFYAYFKDGTKIEFTPKQYKDLGGALMNGLYMQLQHEVKYQQSFDFNLNKNNNKQYQNSPFVKMLSQLKNNKNLLEVGDKGQSGSQSKPQDGQINFAQIEPIKTMTRPVSISIQTVPQEPKSIRTSRKGSRQIREVNKPVRNMKFLQISKINSVLPDKYQLCLQPIRKQARQMQTQSLRTSSTSLLRINVQTQTDFQEFKIVDFKKADIQKSENLSLSFKIIQKPPTQKRYSSVIRTQNRNNIIFKIDFMNQDKQQKVAHFKKISKQIILKHAFSQTLLSFYKERQKEKQVLQEEKMKTSQIFLPSVQTPDRDEKKWARNNSIKYDTMRIGNKRQAEIFLNGVVKKYLGQKSLKSDQPLCIITRALERPKSLRKK